MTNYIITCSAEQKFQMFLKTYLHVKVTISQTQARDCSFILIIKSTVYLLSATTVVVLVVVEVVAVEVCKATI